MRQESQKPLKEIMCLSKSLQLRTAQGHAVFSLLPDNTTCLN